MCCGPCTCYPLKRLRGDNIEPVGYFFNPNIHPYKEWETRLKTAQNFAQISKMELYIDRNYRLKDFLEASLMLEKQGKSRCTMCYTWRLEETARFAKEHDFDAFSSTLFYSIYQQHELMKKRAEYFAEKYGLHFHYEDYRQGWQEGIDISLQLGLYRQGYCGCIFSEEERYSKELRKKRKKEAKARRLLAKVI